MKRKLKYVLLFECLTGIAVCTLYQFCCAPALAAQHLDRQVSLPLILTLLSVLPLLLFCILRKAGKYNGTYFVYFFTILSAVCLTCFIIGLLTECPVCGSPYF